MDKERILEILKMIKEDTENDVNYYEGKEFNGQNVSEYFGKQAAAIVALANILQEVIKNDAS